MDKRYINGLFNLTSILSISAFSLTLSEGPPPIVIVKIYSLGGMKKKLVVYLYSLCHTLCWGIN